MKVLSLNDLPAADDELGLSFEGAYEPRAALDRELDPFLRALETYADGWMPEVVKGKRYRKYSRAAVLRSLDERRDETGTGIELDRTKPPALQSSCGVVM